MALKAVAVTLRDTTVDASSLYSITMQQSNGLKFSMHGFLQKCFDHLEPIDAKYMLMRLSILQAEWFDKKIANHVVVGKQPRSFDANSLTVLEAHHLLEVDHLQQVKRHKPSKLYALHSLVVKFLSSARECNAQMAQEVDIAKDNFIKYICKRTEKCGRKNYSSPNSARVNMEYNKSHVELFFRLVQSERMSLKDCFDGEKNLSRVEFVMRTADFILNHQTLIQFCQNQSETAREVCEQIYWKSRVAISHIACDKTELAYDLLSSVFNEHGVEVRETDCAVYMKPLGWTIDADPTFVVFRLVLARGKTLFHMGRNEKNQPKLSQALVDLKKAEALCDKCREFNVFKVFSKRDMSITQNAIGCVYFAMGDLTKAQGMHKKAIDSISNSIKRSSDSLNQDLIEFKSNLAACQHQLGLNTKDQTVRFRLFESALSEYNKLIDSNKRIGLDCLPPHVSLLRHRAEVYYMKVCLFVCMCVCLFFTP